MSEHTKFVVEPRELNRDTVADVLPRLQLVENALWAMTEAGCEVDASDEHLQALSEIVLGVKRDIEHMLAEDVAWDEAKRDGKPSAPKKT